MTPKFFLLAVISTSTLVAGGAMVVGPYTRENRFFNRPVNQMTVGSFKYRVTYSDDNLGEIQFPRDDEEGARVMILPGRKLGRLQYKESYVHELLHACMHDHEHKFLSNKELKDHLTNRRFSEEDVVETIAPCLVTRLLTP